MPWADKTSPRTPRHVIENVASRTAELVHATRDLLLEHARDHVKRTGGIECPACIKVGFLLPAASEAVRPLIW